MFRYLDERGARVGELAERNGMSPQAFGHHVARMEQLGYVERVPDPQHRRARILRPTAKGLEHLRAAHQAMAAIEADLERRLGGEGLAELRAALERLARR